MHWLVLIMEWTNSSEFRHLSLGNEEDRQEGAAWKGMITGTKLRQNNWTANSGLREGDK